MTINRECNALVVGMVEKVTCIPAITGSEEVLSSIHVKAEFVRPDSSEVTL